jgi:tRNA dimethylallyltransferase
MKTGVICLAGPTASGKTAAALAIAQRIDVEIISVDSALVYRGMDIGTAKPTPAELGAVPHHLIDIRDPLHAYSAADFVRDAQTLIADITARGKMPLLVGGTMLYFKALLDGIDDMPKANPAVRAALEREAAEHGWPALHAELARVDPLTAARLNPADTQRVQRALEVFRISGQPMSFFHNSKTIATHATSTGARGLNGIKNESTEPITSDDANGSALAGASGLVQEPLLISLEPQDRAWLHARIAQRFDAMLAQGFLDEVQALRARGDLHPDLPSMRCVGYRQAWEALDGTSPMPELRDKGVFATRQLAKRQITWLRSMPQRQVVACDAPQALEQVLALVQAHVVRPTRSQA